MRADDKVANPDYAMLQQSPHSSSRQPLQTFICSLIYKVISIHKKPNFSDFFIELGNLMN